MYVWDHPLLTTYYPLTTSCHEVAFLRKTLVMDGACSLTPLVQSNVLTTLESFRSLARVNRVSFGVQALNDGDLRALGRDHSTEVCA